MNVDEYIDHDHRILIFTITGRLTDDGVLGLADRIESNPEVAQDFGWLIDLRMSDGFQITIDGVRRMASRRLALSPSSRRAVVVPRGLGYAMARMYQMLRGDGAPRVFTNYDEALHWATTRTHDGGQPRP